MAEMTWEKSQVGTQPTVKRRGRLKFLIGGVLILASVIYLIVTGTTAEANRSLTVEGLVNSGGQYLGKNVRLTGAVLGETIRYDSQNLVIEFTIANIPEEYDNLAVALHDAVNDPQAERIRVRVEGQVKPDLLQHEAQAILTGKLDADGVFHASELLLKCPTRFEEAQPGQSISKPHA